MNDMDSWEHRLIKMEERADSIVKHFATKDDLHRMHAEIMKAINDQTWRLIGVLLVTFAGVFFIARYVH
jgi:ATP sulfurylase